MFFFRGVTSDDKEFVVMDADAAIASVVLPHIAPHIGIAILIIIYGLISGVDMGAVCALASSIMGWYVVLKILDKFGRLQFPQLLFTLPFHFFSSVIISLWNGVFYKTSSGGEKTFCSVRESSFGYRTGLAEKCEVILILLVVGCCVSFVLFFLCKIMNWRAMSVFMFVFSILAGIIGVIFFMFLNNKIDHFTRLPVFLGLKCFAYAILAIIGGIFIAKAKNLIYKYSLYD